MYIGGSFKLVLKMGNSKMKGSTGNILKLIYNNKVLFHTLLIIETIIFTVMMKNTSPTASKTSAG